MLGGRGPTLVCAVGMPSHPRGPISVCQQAEGPALPAVQPKWMLHGAGTGAAVHHGGEADHQQRAGGGHPVSTPWLARAITRA